MIISVIGSGGKTTKIKQLKDRYLKEGKSVLMTTSTHMKIEENTLVDPSYEEIINEIKKHGYVHAGSKAKNQKIKALDDDLLKRLKKEIDVILIEADGSHGLPLKYPRNHEPVVDKDSSEIILITSLKGLGKPAQDVVHGYQEMKVDGNQRVDSLFIQQLKLKVAPEHVSDRVLKYMGKPENAVYKRFTQRYKAMNEKLGLKQYLVPYLMSSHPGSQLTDAVEMAEHLRDLGYMPEQVQDFYPTPSTISTCMYYTGIDPRTGESVYIPKDPHEKAMQRALIQYRDPKLAQLHHDYLAGGPLEYMAAIFRELADSDEDAMQLALEFYGPMYLLYSVYDGAEEKESVSSLLATHIDHFIAKVEAGYRAEAAGTAVLSRRNNG